MHAYVAVAGGCTKYLSDLKSGSEVLVVNASGHVRPALVGRVKIESRPLVLVEAEVGHVFLCALKPTIFTAVGGFYISTAAACWSAGQASDVLAFPLPKAITCLRIVGSALQCAPSMQVEGFEGNRHSILLQNAETVRLVDPGEKYKFKGVLGVKTNIL